eukprot:m.17561 g.17561  ORF g.17561 m.17561 type:complete len:467 (+) comp5200_c0_seq2:34-1434(+)
MIRQECKRVCRVKVEGGKPHGSRQSARSVVGSTSALVVDVRSSVHLLRGCGHCLGINIGAGLVVSPPRHSLLARTLPRTRTSVLWVQRLRNQVVFLRLLLVGRREVIRVAGLWNKVHLRVRRRISRRGSSRGPPSRHVRCVGHTARRRSSSRVPPSRYVRCVGHTARKDRVGRRHDVLLRPVLALAALEQHNHRNGQQQSEDHPRNHRHHIDPATATPGPVVRSRFRVSRLGGQGGGGARGRHSRSVGGGAGCDCWLIGGCGGSRGWGGGRRRRGAGARRHRRGARSRPRRGTCRGRCGRWGGRACRGRRGRGGSGGWHGGAGRSGGWPPRGWQGCGCVARRITRRSTRRSGWRDRRDAKGVPRRGILAIGGEGQRSAISDGPSRPNPGSKGAPADSKRVAAISAHSTAIASHPKLHRGDGGGVPVIDVRAALVPIMRIGQCRRHPKPASSVDHLEQVARNQRRGS